MDTSGENGAAARSAIVRDGEAASAAPKTPVLPSVSPEGSPISILVGVEAAVAHRGWTLARRAVLEALLHVPCVVVVVGAPGTGKTLLLADLARALAAAGTPPVQYRWGEPGAEQALTSDRLAADGIVLIDEADRMSDATLAGLISDGQCGVVVARERDPDADAHAAAVARGRRLTVVRLEPLAAGETADFIAARLARAGWPGDLIAAEPAARIEACSGGIPRLVNMLASAAIFFAGAEPDAHVDVTHVDEAVEMFGLSPSEFSAGTATDIAGLCSPRSASLATTAEREPVRDEVLEQSEPEKSIPAIPGAAIPILRAHHALAVRSGRGIRHGSPAWRRAAAASVLLVSASAAAGFLYAGKDSHRAQVAISGSPAPSLPPLLAAIPVPPPAAIPVDRLPAEVASLSRHGGADGSAVTAMTAPGIAPPDPVAPPPPLAKAVREAIAEPAKAPLVVATSLVPGGTESGTQRAASVTLRIGAPVQPGLRQAGTARPANVVERAGPRETGVRDSAREGRRTAMAQGWSAPNAEREAGAAAEPSLEPVRQAALGVRPPPQITREPRSPMQELLHARRALAENASSEARDLLESAETSIAFHPGPAPERAGMAAAQISNAIGLLNTGQATSALPYLERAIAAIASNP